MNEPPAGACLDVFLCGGSQLAASGLPPTAALPTRLARGLRAAWGAGASRVRPVYCDVDPDRLAAQLAERLRGRPFAVVLVPRNVPAVLRGPGDAARRLVAPDLSLPAEVAPPTAGRWSRLRQRWMAHGWYAAWLIGLPVRMVRYAARLERAVARCRALGCVLFVVATPVPYPRRLGRRARAYQRLLAALVRRWGGRRVVVADLAATLAAGGAEPILPHDAHHLTAEGHDRAARALVDVLVRAVPPHRCVGDRGRSAPPAGSVNRAA